MLGIPSGLPIIESKKYVELVLNSMIKEATDLAKLSQGLLKGEELTMFIKNRYKDLV